MELRPYQQPHFERLLPILLKNKAALDASDTGTGKTYVALWICKTMGIVPLVIGPKSSRAGWEDAAKLAGVEIEFINYEMVRGRRKTLEDGTRAAAESDYVEEVPWGKGSFIRWKNNYAMIIFDEAHRCGGATSLNSKLMIAAKRQAEYVLALSATAADDPRQMKALGYVLGLHSLSKKTRLQINYMSWLMRHGVSPGVFGGYEFTEDLAKKKRAFMRLHAEVFPARGQRMRKNEIPGFPATTIDIKLLTDFTGGAYTLSEELHELGEERQTGANLAEATGLRQKLEILKVPHFLELAQDYTLTSKVVVFVNFTKPLEEIYERGRKIFGNDRVGFISGSQTGVNGDNERRRFLSLFQANKIDLLVANGVAGGESANMHDPTGQVERTALISPGESGRQLKQIFGRVNRDGGARSLQLLTYFADTYEADVAERLKRKNFNLDLFNDGEFIV